MKKILFIVLIAFLGSNLVAQTLDDYMEVQREALKTEKKAIVAEAMMFTDAESAVFWPLYNEYNNKMYTHNTELYKIIKKFAESYETISDESAVELWTAAMKVEQDLISLEKQYFKKFLKIMPGKKAMRYFQVESKVKTLVEAQMALEIPLVD